MMNEMAAPGRDDSEREERTDALSVLEAQGDLMSLAESVLAYVEAHDAVFRTSVKVDDIMLRVSEINAQRRELRQQALQAIAKLAP